MKRIVSLVLAFVLVMTLLPVLPRRAQAATGGKLIAITFDDGPSSKYTKELLDGLKERGVPATFFMLGERAASYPKLVKRAYEEGHEIACHTWSHPNLTKCTVEEIRKEIEDTLEQLDRACGDEADYLVRPPYGSTNPKVLENIDVPLLYWSIDSEDWSLLNTEKVRKKIVKDAYDGAIILCHDIHKTTIPAALQAIDDLMELGYEFVTVSELYRRRGREMEAHKLHYSSKPNGLDYGPIPAPSISFRGDPKGVNTVTLSCSDTKVPLYYTLDGSYPNQDAFRYTGPFTVPLGTTVTAVAAYKLNGSRSALTVGKATDIQIVSPNITQDVYGSLIMETPTANSKIYYTVDSTPAGKNDNLYEGPVDLEGPCTVRAVTVHEKGVSAERRVYVGTEGSLFYDLPVDQWYFEAMEWAFESGYLNGTAPYTMNPGGKVTRGMLVTLLQRFSGDFLERDWERTNTFLDVNQGYYYAEAIEWAFRNGIVDGYDAKSFGPDDKVTRQQMCKIVASYLNWIEKPLPQGESCEDVFADHRKIADWAKECVEGMVAAGLIQGDGVNMNPNDGANRAQFCVLLQRLFAYEEEYWDKWAPVEPEPTDPEPTDPEPTDPEPTDPAPSEPTHTWKINKTDVSINVGEMFRLSVYCSDAGCSELADTVWTPSTEGVVAIDGRNITGLKAGWNTWLSTEWEGETFKCIVRVRKQTNALPEILMPL